MSKSIHIEIGESYAGLTVRIGNVNGSIEHSNITAEEVLDDIMREIRDVFGVSEQSDVPKTLERLNENTPENNNLTSSENTSELLKRDNKCT